MISVIICTHNRVRYLELCFVSLLRQSAARGSFEILVVDNASTDETKSWAEVARSRAAEAGMILRYVFEPRSGLNNARNAGWQKAQCEFAAFLDDDAVTAADWVQNILLRLRKCENRIGVIGGKVEPLWEITCPEWLTEDLWPYFSVINWSKEELILNRDQYFVGANMVIRTSALKRVGGFHPRLDRQGNNLLSNGEVHLRQLLEDAGYTCLYAPNIVVRHLIPAERMTRRWLRSRAYWQGISDLRMREIISGARCSQESNWREYAKVIAKVGLARLKGRMPEELLLLQRLGHLTARRELRVH
jgi:glucosyl-dolichyl phosphate glucuronosyltransferase